jgi:hypothetical protein
MTPEETRLLHALQQFTAIPYIAEQKIWRQYFDKKKREARRKHGTKAER